jgi:hypothetical protein
MANTAALKALPPMHLLALVIPNRAATIVVEEVVRRLAEVQDITWDIAVDSTHMLVTRRGFRKWIPSRKKFVTTDVLHWFPSSVFSFSKFFGGL